MSDAEVLPPDGITPVLVKRIARGDMQNEKTTLVVVEQDVPMPFLDDRSLRPCGKGRIVAEARASEARRGT